MKRALVFCFFCFALGLTGCGLDEPVGERARRGETFSLALDVDIRNHSDARFTRQDDDLEVELKVDASFGVLPKDQEITGQGRVERFPEADLELFTARFAAPPQQDGPCQAEPVSLALALQHRVKGSRFSGSLTAYCGKDTWAGLPARQPLRLATPGPKE